MSPKGSRIDGDCETYRIALETRVLDAHGEVDVYRAGLIQTSITAVKHAMKAAKWLRDGWDDMSWSERLNMSREIHLACEKRDNAVKKLGLDVTPENDPWRLLDSLPPNTVPESSDAERDESPTPSATDAGDGGTRTQEAHSDG